MSLTEVVTSFNDQFIAAPVQLVSFWLSVTLPLFYVPLCVEETDGTTCIPSLPADRLVVDTVIRRCVRIQF
ncbi:hypothetical protein [Haladaptatus caseinilyticus]|uniref:hypothetical protein n=1 Tax=Haladaptatus caseinilyticus TaxID=2993314 RepID=UPI00224AAB16|nr:hypothetical protein [Haladaptatus caseinilyticus]